LTAGGLGVIPPKPEKGYAMPTYTALTTLPGEDAATALAAAVEKLDPAPTGVGVFEIEDGSALWEVGVYFTEKPSEVMLDVLALAFGARPFAFSELPEIDWVAKVRRELSPVEAGRFYVYGSHDADTVPDDPARVPLQIEATVAFGTGHHGTTLGCLRAFDRLADQGFAPARVADIGCGTAVLAMAAAAILPDAVVIASDIDSVAVDVARANVAINGLEGRVECLEAAGFAHPRLQEIAPYDLIFANILKGPLIELAPNMATHTAPDGIVILSGLLVVQAEAVLQAYDVQGFSLSHREDLGEWSALTLRMRKDHTLVSLHN
jgi:ribosomal protein L11 methyltransferase